MAPKKKIVKSKGSYSVALLMAKVLETNKDFKRSDLGDEGAGHGYGATAAGQKYAEFEELGMLEQNHPNYELMGFAHQAFVDVVLAKRTVSGANIDQAVSRSIAKQIQEKIDGVIMVYTVFGTVDLRCKVVGQRLRDVEKAALEIRALSGVEAATTHIVIDDTDSVLVKKKMAGVLRREENEQHFNSNFSVLKGGSITPDEGQA
jgi:DNA-binding Lrp family transcriptional regulator